MEKRRIIIQLTNAKTGKVIPPPKNADMPYHTARTSKVSTQKGHHSCQIIPITPPTPA